ncbi:MAG: 50S ribosomal protein L10 [Bacilli bacterium]|jgi:large subunit ribosomal protein L10|nr:50S ribosomal protein L10 [Bacilli bacterium]
MNKEVLQAKKDAVSEIEKSIKDSASVAVVSYQGLSVAELTDLRHKLAEKGSAMIVYKNTMVKRALKEAGLTGIEDILDGPNAFVFSKDLTAGPAAVAKFARYHENLVIKGGLIEGKGVDAKGMKELAKMPNREGLLSMFCQCLNDPIRKFASAVDAIAKKPGAASAPAAQ